MTRVSSGTSTVAQYRGKPGTWSPAQRTATPILKIGDHYGEQSHTLWPLQPAQHAEGLGRWQGLEAARGQRPPVDLDRRLATLGRVREQVVDGEDPARNHAIRPALVVAVGWGVAVAAVDEPQPERDAEQRGRALAARDRQQRGLLEPGPPQRPPQLVQRVQALRLAVPQIRVVVLLAALVLLR